MSSGRQKVEKAFLLTGEKVRHESALFGLMERIVADYPTLRLFRCRRWSATSAATSNSASRVSRRCRQGDGRAFVSRWKSAASPGHGRD